MTTFSMTTVTLTTVLLIFLCSVLLSNVVTGQGGPGNSGNPGNQRDEDDEPQGFAGGRGVSRSFPSSSVSGNGCLKNYWFCPNVCRRSGQTCCYCQECFSRILGMTQTCNCCPRGNRCCPKSNSGPWTGNSQKCCPENYWCIGGRRCRNMRPPYNTVQATYTQPTSRTCNNWLWPARDFSEGQSEAHD